MKILSIKYEIEPFGGFDQVQIYKQDGKFNIGLMTKNTHSSFIIFKDIIVGAFAYLGNKSDMDKSCEWFKTYADCEKFLKIITSKKLMTMWDKNKLEINKLLISKNEFKF